MQYTEKVLEHFKNPHNQGIIENADAIGEVGNPACGDVIRVYLKIKNNIIKDIKFETLGCAAAIATSSILTDLVKGMTLEVAEKMTRNKIVESLGGLPQQKVHCSVLGVDALQKAINEYKEKKEA